MKVITLSKTFPKYHPRAGEQTGFADAFLSGRKIHTIRANEKGYYQDGDIVSVRQWSGNPYASKQETLKDGIGISVLPVIIRFDNVSLSIRVRPYLGASFSFVDPSVVADNDGLSLSDFIAWFNPKRMPNLVLNYSMIHFTDFRYE